MPSSISVEVMTSVASSFRLRSDMIFRAFAAVAILCLRDLVVITLSKNKKSKRIGNRYRIVLNEKINLIIIYVRYNYIKLKIYLLN